MHSVIGCKCTLLKDRVRAIYPPNLVPARASDTGQCLYRLVRHQRFVCAKVAVGKTEGRPLAVGENVEQVVRRRRDTRLRETVAGRLSREQAAGEDRVEAGNWELCLEGN